MLKKYSQSILALPSDIHDVDDVLVPGLQIEQNDRLGTWYAPFEYVNAKARLILLGVTPGPTQMTNALRFAREALGQNLSEDALKRDVKRRASFSGPMRKNLVRMLDGVGLHTALRISTTEAIFVHDPDLLHSTSCIRYPTFYRRGPGAPWRPYNATPAIDRDAYLVHYLDTELAPELASIPDALIIPLGASAQRAVEYLARQDDLALTRCILGMPHPSGANNGRIVNEFPRVRAEIADKVKAWFA
ncbi:hypothetical protein PHYC_02193 [Phycisphaerales bacterium]|nr:hypothetical protein PHYC_02193 [Phycisphaerales bacterium]